MESILDQFDWENPWKDSPVDATAVETTAATTAALQALGLALRHVLPLLQKHQLQQREDTKATSTLSTIEEASLSPHFTAIGLLQLLNSLQRNQDASALSADYLLRNVWEASRLPTETQQQAALFDILGESEAAMDLMFTHIAPNLSKIALFSEQEVTQAAASTNTPQQAPETLIDVEEERRTFLLNEAQEAAHLAAVAQAEVEALHATGTAGTHTVTRASDQRVIKAAQKAQQKAILARKRAIEAGVLVDTEENDFSLLSVVDTAGYGAGGLLGQASSADAMAALQATLLPEGSRHYYDQRGLPTNTIIESTNEYEKAIIPAAVRDVSRLPNRLVLTDILTPIERLAFTGTASLNPMQSAVFEQAFHSRENLLICAPTGAGKTNVALLTVVAHFRDVGLLPADPSDTATISRSRTVDTGRKVVYIAPMKALAQEVVEKFSQKLKPMRLIVRELTGDMQLTRSEAQAANVIVTTPEKWDVVTRKSGRDDSALGNQCGLLIIDEVHLLADERGAVLESVVARLHRLVETRQQQIRLVGLSATLPNYEDVGEFLQVSNRGLFYFGPEHRPVPLQQTLIGVHNLDGKSGRDRHQKEKKLNEQCYEVVVDALRRGKQVMVFVHSRKGTGDTAKALTDLAVADGTLEAHFVTQGKDDRYGQAHKRFSDRVKKSRNRELSTYFMNGLGIHHAGMIRDDRKLTESMFNDGAIKVLCCTATLAWGINLPAHTVCIKGTEVYSAEQGKTIDLGVLDIQQIFGRAGRIQYDSSGEAFLITSAEAYARYMNKLVRAVPIESNFIKQLDDHLNAEIVGGTVTTVEEAATWLKYTYLYVRMLRNPMAYGISSDEKADDPLLKRRCTELVTLAARRLATNRMINFDTASGNLSVLNHGRVAAHYYISTQSIETFNERLKPAMTDAQVLHVIASAAEFTNMKVRQEELDELGDLLSSSCPLKIEGAGLDDRGEGLITGPVDKAFVLIQSWISRARLRNFTLISDMNYISSNNASRVIRALLEMCLDMTGMAGPALKLLRFAKSVDNQIWWFQTPLRHFAGELNESSLSAIETRLASQTNDSFSSALSLLDMQPQKVGEIVRSVKNGGRVQSLVKALPNVDISVRSQPITSSVLRFTITYTPIFEWHARWHGGAQSFWTWIEDGVTARIYHHESIVFSRRTFPNPIKVEVLLPAFNPMPSNYVVHCVSDTWQSCEVKHSVALTSLRMPTEKTLWTDLQDLTPLPTTALRDQRFIRLYSEYDTFNPMQTQLFHVLYHTDKPVFLGAPTGSGKTVVAELAVLRMKRHFPKGICVYIAPLTSLARERLKEWRARLGTAPLGWRILELSGDTNHDRVVLERADIVVCTPEKWDIISRGWRGTASGDGTTPINGKDFVNRVKLLLLDEMHLLGEESGAVLEGIVCRTRFISHVLKQHDVAPTRIIGLSTALENPLDLSSFLGIDTASGKPTARHGIYNFRPSVRPVPIIAHIQGFSGRQYGPRMASMNKPVFAAIKQHSRGKPALIFCGSRAQTRLTALDLISFAAVEEYPRLFLRCSEAKIEAFAATVRDESLRHTISFGIGLYHAGLAAADREIVEKLYLQGDLQVLISTATSAWSVNFPARLVVCKGTEYFDSKLKRFVNYPLASVLQMMSCAGRAGFDDEAIAVIMTTQGMRDYYRKFLYHPFPLESRLSDVMCEIINAENAGGTITSVEEAVGFLNWSFLAHRMRSNPSYYGVPSGSDIDVQSALLSITNETVARLARSGCVNQTDETGQLSATILGVASCSYCLSHKTPRQMQIGVRECRKIVQKDTDSVKTLGLGQQPLDEVCLAWLLYTLCNTHEFDDLPVRHNDEIINEALSRKNRWGADTQALLMGVQPFREPDSYANPHTKAFLLVQAFLSRIRLPTSDYINDTKSVMESIPRLLAAMEFIAEGERAAAGSFDLLTQFCRARQYIETRSFPDQDPLLQLGLSETTIRNITMGTRKKKNKIQQIAGLRSLSRPDSLALLHKVSRGGRVEADLDTALDRLYAIPLLRLEEARATAEVDKATGQRIGKLRLQMELERSKPRSGLAKDVSFTILVGSFQNRILLARASVRLTRWGKFTIHKDLSFVWSTAVAHGGENTGSVTIRFIMNEIRGFDAETRLSLQSQGD